MPIHTLRFRTRAGAAGLVGLSLLGLVGVNPTPAEAWTKGQIARHERYLACKVKLQKDPPCNQVWTRYCARRCGGRLI